MFLPFAMALLTGPPAMSAPAAKVQTVFVKVGPMPGVSGRSSGQDRAVVLIHGLGLHMVSAEKPVRAYLRPWQQSDHPLVRRLAQDSDVYALAYGQNLPLGEVVSSEEIHRHVRSLKGIGYKQVVLVGHSAGGLIARELVEDHADLGVTRVVQVCSPNEGSGWAALRTARAAQMPFLVSLTRAGREKVIDQRYPGKRIPDSIGFACVVASCRLGGDGVVSCRSQWSAELQAQGVPAYSIRATHWDAMTSSRTPDLLARLVAEPMPRWDEAKVIEARMALIGK
ncbi:MAG: alpha/beta fold hydrolase [Gemmataceae bacterium]